MDYSRENPDGPTTYVRDIGRVPRAVQVSFALYQGGSDPNPCEYDLQRMSKDLGRSTILVFDTPKWKFWK